jgi:hypothetical protein
MKYSCPYKECTNHADCAILEITGKVPKSFDACSYSKTQSQLDRQLKAKNKKIDVKGKKPKNKKEKRECRNEE